MKRFVIALTIIAAAAATAHAQTFMQHLQQKKDGQAGVTVTQSKEIDELVNKVANVKTNTSATSAHRNDNAATTTATKHDNATKAHTTTAATQNEPKEDAESPVVDTRKKVMRKSYKVDGYRVQVFAGGNSRDDKLKAQRTGDDIKQAFPEQPVYVHFYSPRWICRVGNFRTFEEANEILHQIQKMGYKQACIVSGKITVPY